MVIGRVLYIDPDNTFTRLDSTGSDRLFLVILTCIIARFFHVATLPHDRTYSSIAFFFTSNFPWLDTERQPSLAGVFGVSAAPPWVWCFSVGLSDSHAAVAPLYFRSLAFIASYNPLVCAYW